MIKWNMNYKVRVRLTNEGWELFQDEVRGSDGYVVDCNFEEYGSTYTLIELPMWYFMEIFGSAGHNLSDYCSMHIELEEV